MSGRRSGRRARQRAAGAVLLVAAGAVLTGCARTSIPGLQVHTGPGTGYPVTGAVARAETAVAVVCWVHGDAVFGDPVWYRIRSPQAGYVTNYYIRTTGDHANTRPC